MIAKVTFTVAVNDEFARAFGKTDKERTGVLEDTGLSAVLYLQDEIEQRMEEMADKYFEDVDLPPDLIKVRFGIGEDDYEATKRLEYS
jgi:hypothetical protein